MTLSAQWSFSCIEPEYLRAFTLKFISLLIIHQRLLLARDWSKRSTWPNTPPPPPAKIGWYPRISPKRYSPIFKPYVHHEKYSFQISLDITCSSKLKVFLELRSRKTVRILEQIMSADKYPYIFSRQIEAIIYTFACIFVEQKSLSRRKCLKHTIANIATQRL